MKIRLNHCLLTCLLAVLPLRFVPSPNDSSETNIGAYGGFGQYAQISRGCEGQVLDKDIAPFNEVGITFDHKTRSALRYGMHGSYFTYKKITEHWDEEQINEIKTSSTDHIVAVHPFANLEWKYFTFGLGVLLTNRPLLISGEADEDAAKGMTSLYFKGGSSDRFYVDFSMSHMPPILSGDNFRFGIGAGQPGYDLWADIGFGMYDAPGVLFRAKLKLDPNFSLITYGRYMESERIHEYTLNFGLNYRFNK